MREWARAVAGAAVSVCTFAAMEKAGLAHVYFTASACAGLAIGTANVLRDWRMREVRVCVIQFFWPGAVLLAPWWTKEQELRRRERLVRKVMEA